MNMLELCCAQTSCVYERKDKSSRRSIVVLKGWLNMQCAKIADELKVDMKVIRIRNYLDPQ